MAVKLETSAKAHKADEQEVASCVSNLVKAFSDGLNVFKKLRERRRKRKARKETQPPETANSDEKQLSKSLRRGPEELAEIYDACYLQTGRSFAKGDGKLHLETHIVGVTANEPVNSNRTCVARRNIDQTKYWPSRDNSIISEP